MNDRAHRLPVSHQAEGLSISCSTACALERSIADHDGQLMKRIDLSHLEKVSAGSRILGDLLVQKRIMVVRKHVGTPTIRTGTKALCRKPCTTQTRHTESISTCYVA